MPKIGFDISGLDPNFKEHSTRGIGRYIREFANRVENNPDIELVDLHKRIQGRLLDSVDCLPVAKQTIKQQIVYPFLLSSRTKNIDLLHFAAQTDAPAWCPKPYVITVHDVIPLVLEELYTKHQPTWRFKLGRFLELQSMKSAKHIMTVSECSKRDIIKYVNVPADKISVIPNGIDESFFVPTALDLEEIRHKYELPPGKLVIYVGGIDQRKNMIGNLEVIKELNKHDRFNLIVVGKNKKSKDYTEFHENIKKLGLTDRVFELGFVPDLELIALYQICDVFLFLSLYEGFGLPPLEAMAAGIPVVTSNTSSVGEVIGDAGIGVDPTDISQAVQGVLSVLSSSDLKNKLLESGKKQAKKFNWDNTVKGTLDVYQAVLENRY